MYGQVVHQQGTANGTGIIYINTSGWSKGVYVLVGGDAQKVNGKKFVVQ